jgi:hypothetical protein
MAMEYAVGKASIYRPGVSMADFKQWIDARGMAVSSISANWPMSDLMIIENEPALL